MANKALIGLLAASFFGCGDGCREAHKKLEETQSYTEQIPTMISETDSHSRPITAMQVNAQMYLIAEALKTGEELATGNEEAVEEEPNAITSPIEQMISYYEENASPSISFRGHRKITLNTEYERGKKAEIQQILIDNEYLDAEHAVDGCFDNDTIKAVKKFQEENDLSQDGVVGYTTIPLLEAISDLELDENHYAFSKDSACVLNENDRTLIAEIEAALNFHHYASLPVDGELDDATVEAIRLYKRRNVINSDSIDSALISHLSTSSRKRVEKLEEALEAMNSLSRHGPDTDNHVYVNLPELQVRFYYNNNLELQMDIIIGKKGRWETDIQSGRIKEARINPWWHVPAGEMSREIRRDLRPDDSWLRQEMEQLVNGQWELIGDNAVMRTQFRQRPGPLNPFGRILYGFGSREGEFLHGTAKHYLFMNNKRLLSHGCMRLHNEFEVFHTFQRLGLIDESLNPEEMAEEIGSDGLYRTQDITIAEPIPVNVIYVRAWVDDSSENGLFMTMPKDVYNKGESEVRR